MEKARGVIMGSVNNMEQASVVMAMKNIWEMVEKVRMVVKKEAVNMAEVVANRAVTTVDMHPEKHIAQKEIDSFQHQHNNHHHPNLQISYTTRVNPLINHETNNKPEKFICDHQNPYPNNTYYWIFPPTTQTKTSIL